MLSLWTLLWDYEISKQPNNEISYSSSFAAFQSVVRNAFSVYLFIFLSLIQQTPTAGLLCDKVYTTREISLSILLQMVSWNIS